jgi:hypothetical protein
MPSAVYEPKSILAIYRVAIKNVPILKYSWVLIAAICVLAMAAYFKLKNSDVFGYALALIVISFLGFVFSFLLKTKDHIIRFLLYFLIGSIVLTMSAIILSFASFIFFKRPDFFAKWFSDKTQNSNSNDNNTAKKESASVMNFAETKPFPKLIYNVNEKDGIKLIFTSNERKITDTILVPKSISPEQLEDNIIRNYGIRYAIENIYDSVLRNIAKYRLELHLTHEEKIVPSSVGNTIYDLGWKDFDRLMISFLIKTEEKHYLKKR